MNVARSLKIAVLSFAIATLGACSTDPTKRKVGVALSDTAISTRIKTALLSDPDVKGHDVSVETFRGTVQLSGFVDTPQSAARAGDIARRVDGVREVRNALIVK